MPRRWHRGQHAPRVVCGIVFLVLAEGFLGRTALALAAKHLDAIENRTARQAAACTWDWSPGAPLPARRVELFVDVPVRSVPAGDRVDPPVDCLGGQMVASGGH